GGSACGVRACPHLFEIVAVVKDTNSAGRDAKPVFVVTRAIAGVTDHGYTATVQERGIGSMEIRSVALLLDWPSAPYRQYYAWHTGENRRYASGDRNHVLPEVYSDRVLPREQNKHGQRVTRKVGGQRPKQPYRFSQIRPLH